MTKARDSQRQRVYDWELQHITPLDPTTPVIEQKTIRSKRPSRKYSLGHDSSGAPIPYFALRIEKRIVSGGITPAQAAALTRKVCTAYGITRLPAIAWGVRGGTWARTGWGWGRIVLPMWARSNHVLLHELAHWVHDAWEHGLVGPIPHPLPGQQQSHGPEYLGILIELLDRFGGMDFATISRAAQDAGLRVQFAHIPHART